MKKIYSITFAFLCLLSSNRRLSAQSFQNLDFEGHWSNGNIPGWTAFYYTVANMPSSYIQPSTANNLDIPIVQMVDQQSAGMTPIQGNQSLFLQATPNFGPGYVSISQTGLVPTGTKSLTLSVLNPFGHGADPVFDAPVLDVTFAGHDLLLHSLSDPAVGTVVQYGADISAYSGMTGSLVISAIQTGGHRMNGVPEDWAEIDNVQFSDVAIPVPEASSFSLWGASACLVAAFILPKNKRASALTR